MGGYHLCSFPQASDTIQVLTEVEDVNQCPQSSSLKLLFDVFHCQILHGDISMHMRRYHDLIGHVQIAGVPDRAEPDANQEVNFAHIFRLLRQELSYIGHIGCEYIPQAGTECGLGWVEKLSVE